MTILQKLSIPHESVNDTSVIIIALNFREGDPIKIGDIVAEYETSKTIVSIESECNGYIFYNCEVGDTVSIGTTIAEVWASASRTVSQKNQKLAPIDVGPLFSKSARDLLLKLNLKTDAFMDYDFINAEDLLIILNKKKEPRVVEKETPVRSRKPKLEFDNERIVIICPTKISLEVIFDILDGQEDKKIVGYVADEEYRNNSDLTFLDTSVLDFPNKIDKKSYDTAVIAMGGSLKSMQFRKVIYERYAAQGIEFTNLISKKANIGKNVMLGSGNLIGSGVFIGTGTTIGNNNFISYMTTIGHHNKIGNNNLFAPGVMMAGLVEVGNDCILTTGVNFIDKVKIGNRVILPLGYNVVSDLGDDKIIKIKSSS